MKKSKLIQVFETLSLKELRELERWVMSPVINRQAILGRFLTYLIECRELLGQMPDKKQAFAKVFPDLLYDDVKMRLLMSDLLRLIEKYLVFADYFSVPLRTQTHLATIYRRRNLPVQFQRSIQSVRKLQEKTLRRDAAYYYNSYLMQLEQFQFQSTTQPTGELSFEQMSNTLDISFLAYKLRQSCLRLSQQTVYKSESDGNFPPAFLEYIEQNFLEVPLIRLYYFSFKSLTQPEVESHYYQFKQLLDQYSDIVPQSELRDLILLAINFCIRKINNGELSYYQEVLLLYKEGLEKEFLLENGELSRFTYHNIATSGLRSGEYQWVESFIRDYRSALHPDYQNTSYNFNRSRLEYSRKNYKVALRLLLQANYKDLLLNLAAKTVQLKVYYEIGEFSLLESHLEAMKMFVRRKKVIGYHQTNYLNIIQYTQKLLAVNQFDRKERDRLVQAIQQEEILTEREWLLKQLTS